MIGHAMKRVREDRECKLLSVAIVELLLLSPPEAEKPEDGTANSNGGAVAAVNPFTINLALAFLTFGVNCCTSAECGDLFPDLLTFLGSNYDRNQRHNGKDNSNSASDISNSSSDSGDGVGHLLDPSRKMRYDQTWHLILRCLESISNNPTENAASRRAQGKSASTVSSSSSKASSNGSSKDGQTNDAAEVPSLIKTKQLLASNPILASTLFTLFSTIFFYMPLPTNSTLVPNGLSSSSYLRLMGGAATESSQKSQGSKSWKEEFGTSSRGGLRVLKLKLLNLIAPCRKHALFLPEKRSYFIRKKLCTDSTNASNHASGDVSSSQDDAVVDANNDSSRNNHHDELGVSHTVALMVLLTGDSDPDVRYKAESYLRAHMDTYRGKEVPQQQQSDNDSAGGSGSGGDGSNPSEALLVPGTTGGAGETTTKETMSVTMPSTETP